MRTWAKRSSPDGDKFGTGMTEGLIAAEAGNNACVAGAMFTHGVRPGPLIMIGPPELVYQVVAMVLRASTAKLILGLSMVRALVKVLLVPREKLMPIVFVLCVVGSFAIILGDILDKNLRRVLILSDGDAIPFFTPPICAVLAVVTVLTIVSKMSWFRSAVGGAKSAAVGGVRSHLGISRKDESGRKEDHE